MIAPVELVRELLYYRDMGLVKREWGLIAAFLAGSSLWMPIFAPFAGASVIALAISKWRAMRKRSEIVGVSVEIPAPLPSATTVYGVARRFRGGGDVLLSHASVRDAKGGVLVRQTRAQPFLLEASDGAVLVTGAVRVRAPSFIASRSVVKRDELRAMGIPDDFWISGQLETSELRVDAEHVAVTGVLADEAVPEMAFARDGGTMRVLRGTPGAPLIISDRRLVGALIT